MHKYCIYIISSLPSSAPVPPVYPIPYQNHEWPLSLELFLLLIHFALLVLRAWILAAVFVTPRTGDALVWFLLLRLSPLHIACVWGLSFGCTICHVKEWRHSFKNICDFPWDISSHGYYGSFYITRHFNMLLFIASFRFLSSFLGCQYAHLHALLWHTVFYVNLYGHQLVEGTLWEVLAFRTATSTSVLLLLEEFLLLISQLQHFW